MMLLPLEQLQLAKLILTKRLRLRLFRNTALDDDDDDDDRTRKEEYGIIISRIS